MRNSVLRPALLAITLAALTHAAPAVADPKSPAVYRTAVSGVQVDGYGESQQGCITTTWRLGAVRNNRGTANQVPDFLRGYTAYYWVSRYDACTGDDEPLSFFIGHERPALFRVAGDLSSAHLRASIPLYDPDTGAYGGRVEIDQTWTATAPAVRDSWHFRDSFGRTVTQFNGLLRVASSEGTTRLTSADIGRYTSVYVQVLAGPGEF